MSRIDLLRDVNVDEELRQQLTAAAQPGSTGTGARADAACRIAEGVIETLALSEAEQREHVASLQADVQVYRELMQETLSQLRAKNTENKQLQARIGLLVAELREARHDAQQARAQLRSYREQAA
jgi:hypothetical protein